MAPRVVLLPGDGIGPEITAPTLDVLKAAGADLEYEEHVFGGASIDAHGTALTDDTLNACKRADAVLLAAVGGPKWDTTDPDKPRPEQGLLGLRKGLGLFANLRPVKPLPALYDASPLKRELIEGTDMIVIRELTGGIYFGEKTRTPDRASDDCVYTRDEIERIARVAFNTAKSRVTSVDKANVLETSRLWREVVRDVHTAEYPNIELEHLLVDNAAMKLIAAPRHFEVIRHREHVRGHPQRRGGDAHRLDRNAPQRVAGRRKARPVRTRPRIRPRHRRAPEPPTRWRCSCRRR